MPEIEKFEISADQKHVTWIFNENVINLHFNKAIYQGILLKRTNQILIISDIKESGRNNMTIFNPDGSENTRLNTPNQQKNISGIYSMWYVEGNDEQTVTFIPETTENYDLKCRFNLHTLSFTDFSVTK